MRILHIYSGNLYGGVERLLATLFRHQDGDHPLEQDFALCYEGRLSRELRSCGARVHLLGPARASRPWTILSARAKLKEILRSGNYDAGVCHMPWALSFFGTAVRSTDTPLVYWCYSPVRGRHWLERWASRIRPDLALCSSRFIEENCRLIYAGVPHAVIYPAVTPQPAVPNSQALELRRELETREESVVIIQVSRMEAWKGQEMLLGALSRLRDRTDWTCWIVGGAQRAEEARYQDKLKKLALAQGIENRVRFLGDREDVQRILNASDIFCQPNITPEPFGLVFAEALYAGLPVVASASGGTLEIVNEACGRLTPPGDPSALASALRELLSDQALRRRLGAAGPARARELCDPSAQLRLLSNAVESLPIQPKTSRTS